MKKNDKKKRILPKVADWRAMMESRILRNEAVIEKVEHGHTQLMVPVKKPRWHVPPISWIVPIRKKRIFIPDETGLEIWEMLNQPICVEEMVDRFAQQHQLTFHESRVLVTHYIRELLQHRLIAVALSD